MLAFQFLNMPERQTLFYNNIGRWQNPLLATMMLTPEHAPAKLFS